MEKLKLLLLLQCLTVLSWGQYSLKGVVSGNGGPLPGANVLIENSFSGQPADSEGRFEFKNLKRGIYKLKISFVGYEPRVFSVELNKNEEVSVELILSTILTDEILVSGTRAKDKTPVAYTNISGEEMAGRNLGQDIPYLLSLSPSFVATSDGGSGVGYTSFRIRGTDMNRVNVTVNGIPLNDAESHGTWFVDLPDLVSSVEDVQVQRGVGTSSNGAAAFGATINLQTNSFRKEAYSEFRSAAGSYNTFKNTIAAGTGLIGGKFTVDTRLSKISSDGFIDRAFSNLKSFYVSAGYYTEKTILKVNAFSGFEETYQAWNGVPSVRLNDDLQGMQRYADHWLYTQKEVDQMIASDNRTYNLYTYKNQVDHFQQDHYQLFFSHKFNSSLNFNSAFHYTYGRGYYENFKEGQDFADYRMDYPVVGTETIESTDLVNRKWLDNIFYGMTFALNYLKAGNDVTFGGGWNIYDGRHFGKVIWAKYYGETDPSHDWYKGTGLKKDFNLYAKYNLLLTEKLSLYADLQFRHIDYQITGIDDNLRDIEQSHVFDFFNPKVGVFFKPEGHQELYLSFSRANREPNRDNYVDAKPGYKPPVFETLNDLEAGYKYHSGRFSGAANFYCMFYKNQLILTGELNDVGDPIMINADISFRAGIELATILKISKSLKWEVNSTFSKNRVRDFVEYVDDWDNGGQKPFNPGTTNLAFSPQLVSNSRFSWLPFRNLEVELLSSYVGKQYIDNSSSEDRRLDAWFVNNLNIGYSIKPGLFEEIKLHLQINNLFNEEYESNAWVYSYIYGGERFKMDGYFPQAGTSFMAGVDFKF